MGEGEGGGNIRGGKGNMTEGEGGLIMRKFRVIETQTYTPTYA